MEIRVINVRSLEFDTLGYNPVQSWHVGGKNHRIVCNHMTQDTRQHHKYLPPSKPIRCLCLAVSLYFALQAVVIRLEMAKKVKQSVYRPEHTLVVLWG